MIALIAVTVGCFLLSAVCVVVCIRLDRKQAAREQRQRYAHRIEANGVSRRDLDRAISGIEQAISRGARRGTGRAK